MTEIQINKKYDLEERTFEFAKSIRSFVKKLPRTLDYIDDIKQLLRASGSVGANYIEANDFLGKKDFMMKIKICRREAKETKYWLKLISCNEMSDLNKERAKLIQEASELTSIFGSILKKTQ